MMRSNLRFLHGKKKAFQNTALAAGALIVIGCTWTRFDDVTDNPPVERFETPSSTSNLGLSIATYSGAIGTKLVASANERIALYDLGTGTNPSTTATSSQSCDGDNSCVLARSLAAVKSEALTGNAGCVAYGMGTVTESSGTASGKIWLHCEDSARHSLDLPPKMQSWLTTTSLTHQSTFLVASPRTMNTAALVAASPDASLAWFYPGSSATAIELPALPDGKYVGRARAVIPHDASYTIAASSQTTNEVYLFEVDATGTPSLTGCLAGPEQFGRLLSSGMFDVGLSVTSLLVADAKTIYAIDISSSALPAANATPTCIDVAATNAVMASCASVGNVNGCGTQPFAASIAAANLDGLDIDELVVGVPDANVRGESSAGAVFVYARDGNEFKVTDGLFVSSATSGDRLGMSVAAAPAAGIDRIVAGAPGDNSVMEFFCNSRVPADAKAARRP